ncbi:hypothetical protein RRG08_015426 [Elysia crispata]|uniref:Uncharacterized protein n=1 Tax=Elysia crispata TaxID=231223 RepID=A0AAE1CYS4_9GAST|nr:hypothetical protein RRG08_015426 [Elysia crispata]
MLSPVPTLRIVKITVLISDKIWSLRTSVLIASGCLSPALFTLSFYCRYDLPCLPLPLQLLARLNPPMTRGGLLAAPHLTCSEAVLKTSQIMERQAMSPSSCLDLTTQCPLSTGSIC